MFSGPNDETTHLHPDSEAVTIRSVLAGLRGDVTGALDPGVEANLLECAQTAVFHARRMGMVSQDGVDTLAAICLVLGKRRGEFFENVFLKRMIDNPRLSANLKLNRLVEIVIGTVPRPEKRGWNDSSLRESV